MAYHAPKEPVVVSYDLRKQATAALAEWPAGGPIFTDALLEVGLVPVPRNAREADYLPIIARKWARAMGILPVRR